MSKIKEMDMKKPWVFCGLIILMFGLVGLSWGQTEFGPYRAANPMTTSGDIIYGGTIGTETRLAGNTTATKKFLTQTGTGSASAAPSWGTLAAGDIPDISGTYILLSQKDAASGVPSLTAGSLVTQNPANATATPTASKIPIADGSGKLDGWLTNPLIINITGNVSGSSGSCTGNAATVTNGVYLTTAQTLTNKHITPRVVTLPSDDATIDSSSTPPFNTDNADQFIVTAMAQATDFGAPGGTPTDGQKFLLRVKDNGTARALTWNAVFRAGTDIALPNTTVLSKTMYFSFIYNLADTKWDFVGTVGGL